MDFSMMMGGIYLSATVAKLYGSVADALSEYITWLGTVISALLGIYSVAAGLGGYLEDDLNPVLRLALVAGGLCMLIPGTLTDIIGLVVLVGVIALQRMTKKKAAA